MVATGSDWMSCSLEAGGLIAAFIILSQLDAGYPVLRL